MLRFLPFVLVVVFASCTDVPSSPLLSQTGLGARDVPTATVARKTFPQIMKKVRTSPELANLRQLVADIDAIGVEGAKKDPQLARRAERVMVAFYGANPEMLHLDAYCPPQPSAELGMMRSSGGCWYETGKALLFGSIAVAEFYTCVGTLGYTCVLAAGAGAAAIDAADDLVECWCENDPQYANDPDCEEE